jgi:hypothetical protein
MTTLPGLAGPGGEAVPGDIHRGGGCLHGAVRVDAEGDDAGIDADAGDLEARDGACRGGGGRGDGACDIGAGWGGGDDGAGLGDIARGRLAAAEGVDEDEAAGEAQAKRRREGEGAEQAALDRLIVIDVSKHVRFRPGQISDSGA